MYDAPMRRIAVVVGCVIASIGCDAAPKKKADSAKDSAERYEIAKRADVIADMCAMATATAQAYLVEKNEAEYKKWKAVETGDCARAKAADFVPTVGPITEPFEPAPSAGIAPLDVAIAGLANWKNKMCACTDIVCADKTHEEYKAWESNVLEPMFKGKKESDMPKDKMQTAEKLDDERKDCRRNLRDGQADAALAAEAMAKMSEFKDQMCTCLNAECAKKVSDEMMKWSQAMAGRATRPPRMSEADQKKATEIGTAMGECMQKAMAVSGN